MSSSNNKLKVGIICYGDVGKKRHSIFKKYEQLNSKTVSDINYQLALVLPTNIKGFNEQR